MQSVAFLVTSMTLTFYSENQLRDKFDLNTINVLVKIVFTRQFSKSSLDLLADLKIDVIISSLVTYVPTMMKRHPTVWSLSYSQGL